MPNKKRKPGKGKSKQAKQAAQTSQLTMPTAATGASLSAAVSMAAAEEAKVAVSKRTAIVLDEDDEHALSTQDIRAMVDRTQEYADSNLHLSSLGDLHSHMQNTISMMRGDKTITETTASVSNVEGGNITVLPRSGDARGEDEDELGLSQLASAVNQISAAHLNVSQLQQSIVTGQDSNMLQLEDHTDVDGQNLQKTQIYEDTHAAKNPTIQDRIVCSIPRYDAQAPMSHESTFIREEADNSAEQIKLFTPLLLQQLMLNSEQILSHNKTLASGRNKNFAPFDFTEGMLLDSAEASKLDNHFIGAHFDDEITACNDSNGEPAPVLGLNLREYFQKRHLVDQLPVEPLPPIENPLEMTQNHEDWVRGQEDFKINLEQLQGLTQPDKDGRGNVFPSELVGDAAQNVFNPVAQHELAAYNETMNSAASSFDNKSWETLTQAHMNFRKSPTNAKIEELPPHGVAQGVRRRGKNQPVSQSMLLTMSAQVANEEEEKTDPGAFLAQELDTAHNLSSQQSQLTQTFIEHPKTDQIVGSEKNKNQQLAQNHGNNTQQQQQLQPVLSRDQEVFINTESSISKDADRDSQDTLECFISQPELQQLLQLESSLFNLLQDTNISEFMVPNRQGQADHASDFNDEEYESFFEPMAPQIGGSLKNLENYLIKGDLRNCVLCNSKYSKGDLKRGQAANLPRVLYCGDSLCESCIMKQIQRASISSGSNIQNVAACQVICPVCDVKHIFKLTKTGFLVCNDKYIKVQDEKGPVNFFPSSKINPATLQLDKDALSVNLMDNSISIPNSLVIRSLPINVELLDLLQTTRKVQNPSQIEISSIEPDVQHVPAHRPKQDSQASPAQLLSQTLAKPHEAKKVVNDLEEHMEAFNVEEFVREYEKEILQRLSSHDNLRPPHSSSQEGATSLSMPQKIKQDNLLSAFDETEEVATKMIEADQTLEHPADLLKPSIMNQLSAHSSQDENRICRTLSTISNKPHGTSQTQQSSKQLNLNLTKQLMLADLQDRFEGKKESSYSGLEEKARKRKEQQQTQKVGTLRKKGSQLSGSKPHQAFKTHQYPSSASASIQTISAGNNASAQAIFKKKRKEKKKYLFLKERRDSSYSSSSDDQQQLFMMKSSALGSAIMDPCRPHISSLFQGVGASPVILPDSATSSKLHDNEASASSHATEAPLKRSEQENSATGLRAAGSNMGHVSGENLIPLEIETLGGKSTTVLMTQCDRLSDGSDLSPEEIASENSLKRVSMEMLQASQQVHLPPQLMLMSNVLNDAAETGATKAVAPAEESKIECLTCPSRACICSTTLEPMVPESELSVEKKRAMRWAQEERRREKKKNNKEAEIEESQKLKDALQDGDMGILKSLQAKSELEQLLDKQLQGKQRGTEEIKGALDDVLAQQDGPQTIPDYAYFVSQLAQQQAAQQLQTKVVQQAHEDSASKKKARRNKKKRRRQQMLLQAQQLAELMNGHQVGEDCEADMYTLLVPVEETQLQPDPDSKQGAVKLKYVLTARDYFDSETLQYEQDNQSGISAKSSCITLEAPDLSFGAALDPQLRVSISCSACCRISDDQMMWYRCDSKAQDNVSFAVVDGQADAGNAFQFTKTQLQVLKELVDHGLMNIPSHYCETCNASEQQCYQTSRMDVNGKARAAKGDGVGESPGEEHLLAESGSGFKDVSKLCFCCTIQHRLDNPSHHLVMIMPLQLLTLQIKRSEHMEHSVRQLIGSLQQLTAENQIAALVDQLQSCLIDACSSKPESAAPTSKVKVAQPSQHHKK